MSGDITIELYPGDAPVTVDNFLGYVNGGTYNGLVFHRILVDFMIQGGGYFYNNTDRKFYPAWSLSDPIINESYNGLSNVRGTISMARTDEPDSATSQFFINHDDNLFLDRENAEDGYGYCVFGAVEEGMDVVDTIAQIPVIEYEQTNPSFYSDGLPTSYVGMDQPYVLPCETSYCAALSGGIRIGFEDFAIFASHWLDDCESVGSFCGGADLDYSGSVDMVDLELFLWHWAQSVGHEPQFSDLVINNVVDLDDLSALMDHWLETGCDESNDYCGGADINHDASVNLSDYSLFSANWLNSY